MSPVFLGAVWAMGVMALAPRCWCWDDWSGGVVRFSPAYALYVLVWPVTLISLLAVLIVCALPPVERPSVVRERRFRTSGRLLTWS